MRYILIISLIALLWSGDALAQVSLAISSGNTLAVSGNMTIAVSGNWQNNGTFIPGSGTVSFEGAATQSINNPSGETFNNLTVNNSGGSVALNSNVTVNDTLTLSSGQVDNAANTLSIGNGCTIYRASGSLAAIPSFGSSVDVIYANSSNIATGYELPDVVNNLTNDGAGDVLLNKSITVEGALTTNAGDVDLNGSVITLGAVAVLSETGGNTVKGTSGYLTVVRDLNAPSGLDVAGLGAEITSSANLGLTEIRRGHAAQTGNANSGILRYYEITPTNNSGLGATLVFNYDDSELNGNTETNLVLFRSTDGGTNWLYEAGTVNAVANTVTLSGVEAFSRWSAADSDNPLVVFNILVNAKAFLQGPYSGGSMNTYLRDNSLLPLNQPYNTAPWNYNGAESVAEFPIGVVDWVLLEIRGGVQASSLKTRRAAFIKSDGAIVDLDGVSLVSFVLSAADYYIVLRHRNHLALMTPGLITVNQASSLHNFTTGQNQAYGLNPMKDLGGGVFGMRSGDGNSDGGVDALDKNLEWRPNNGGAWAYGIFADFNLDGGIDALDLNLHWRPNNGTATQVPEGAMAAPVGGSSKDSQEFRRKSIKGKHDKKHPGHDVVKKPSGKSRSSRGKGKQNVQKKSNSRNKY